MAVASSDIIKSELPLLGGTTGVDGVLKSNLDVQPANKRKPSVYIKMFFFMIVLFRK